MERQFRLIGVVQPNAAIRGEYRETLWGYSYQPLTIVGEFKVALVSGANLAASHRVYLPVVLRQAR